MSRFAPWLGALSIIIVVFGTIYAVVQQSQRLGANYPQVQLAEDTAAALDNGAAPAGIGGRVAIGKSLAPFVIVYDKAGRPVGGSGYLDGKLPAVPYGVLTAARGRSYHFVTWRPEPAIRLAAVSVAANNYYVLSGRSLREVEAIDSRVLGLAAFGCMLSLLLLSAAWVISVRTPSSPKSDS